MIEIRDGYELGLLMRVMNCIDAPDYQAAGLDNETARDLIHGGTGAFCRLGDADAEKAASVIMARYQPQAERARARAVANSAPPQPDPDRLREDRDERRRLAAEDGV